MMSRPFGSEMYSIGGITFHVWRNRLQNEMPAAETNPILWFASEGSDMLVCGVKTKREVLRFVESELGIPPGRLMT